MTTPPPHAQLITLLAVVLVLVPLMYLRLRKLGADQPLKWKRLWVRPVIILALAAFVMAEAPPRLADLPWLALALALGGVAGWHWGRTMTIAMHPENGTLMARGSQAAMLVLVVLVLVRLGLKAGLWLEGGAWHVNVLLVSDASIVFSAGLFAVRGLEMFLRARKVMTHGLS